MTLRKIDIMYRTDCAYQVVLYHDRILYKHDPNFMYDQGYEDPFKTYMILDNTEMADQFYNAFTASRPDDAIGLSDCYWGLQRDTEALVIMFKLNQGLPGIINLFNIELTTLNLALEILNMAIETLEIVVHKTLTKDIKDCFDYYLSGTVTKN